MELQYNINYEVAAFLFMVVLAYYIRWQYNMTTSKNRTFFRILLFVISANFLDVVTAITISYATVIPYWVNMVLNGVYFGIVVFMSIQYLEYSFELTDRRKYRVFHIIENVVAAISILILIINCFTGICFDFIDGQYVHGPLYMMIYVAPYLMLIMSMFVMFSNYRKWDMSQRLSMILYYLLCFSGFFLQKFFFPTVLLNLFTLSLSVLIILFAMETTDYQELVHTLDEMNVLNEKNYAAMETKRRFIDNISTNIRNPVKNIIANDERIMNLLSGEEAGSIAENNLRTASALLGVLDDIVDYSEEEINDISIVEELYEVKSLINTCILGLMDKIEAKNLKLNVEYDKTLPLVLYGDRDRITQILREVILNAIANTDEGSITVKTTWKEYDRRHILLLFSVEDTGRGVPEDIRDTVFSSFKTVSVSSLNEGEKRFGLGLALTKKMVEVMNGDMGFYSEEGKGTLFYIEFPQKIYED